MTPINYEKKYKGLYQRVAKMLVDNYKAKEKLSAHQLLMEWDKIRDEE